MSSVVVDVSPDFSIFEYICWLTPSLLASLAWLSPCALRKAFRAKARSAVVFMLFTESTIHYVLDNTIYGLLMHVNTINRLWDGHCLAIREFDLNAAIAL